MRMEANLPVCSQGDLRAAQYALHLAAENEADPEKRAALERIEDALDNITNHYGADAIASDAIVEDADG